MININKIRVATNFLLKPFLVGAGFVMTLSPVFMMDAAVAGVFHASHTAFYEVSIGRVDDKSSIVDARGRMVVQWGLTCDGWTTHQRLIVGMAPGEGEPIVSETTISSFESLDGKTYSFDSEMKIGGETAELVRGKVNRPGPGQPGSARYSEPHGLILDLPGNTVFPFEHTIAVLEAAERGERRAFSYYFDGSQPDKSPMVANSLILGKSRHPSEGAQNTFGKLSDAKWWSVRLAMFDGQAARPGNEVPEFEMTQLLQENGVVRRFVFDFGDFTLIAALVEIEEIARPKCG